MAEANLLVRITGSGKELINEFHKIGNAADSTGKQTSSGWEKAGKGIAAAGAGIAGVALAIAAKSLSMADTFEVAHARLVGAVKNTGGNMKDLAGPISAVDDKLVNLGFKSSDTESSLATLTTATHSTGKAIGLMGLAADIARGRHIDLGTATGILTKVETGHVSMLGRLGLATKDAAGKTISTQSAIDELTGAYKGQAQLFTGTFAGAQDVASAKMNQVGVSIGEKLTPMLQALESFLIDKVIPAFGKVVGWVEQEWPKLMSAIKPVLDTIRGYVTGFVDTLETAWHTFGGRILSFATDAWGSIKTVISGVLDVISGIFRLFADLFTGKWGKLWGDVKTILSGAWKLITGAIGLAVTAFESLFSGAWTAILNGITHAWSGIISWLSGVPGKIWNFFQHLPGQFLGLGGDIINAIVQGIENAAGAVGGAIKGILKSIPGGGLVTKALSFLASGGPVSANMPYIVGEAGPELFVPNAGGRIVPNGQITAGGAAGGGGMVINVTVNAGTAIGTSSEFQQAVMRALRQAGSTKNQSANYGQQVQFT